MKQKLQKDPDNFKKTQKYLCNKILIIRHKTQHCVIKYQHNNRNCYALKELYKL